MKKNYIMPCNKVCNIDVTESILGLSNDNGDGAVESENNATTDGSQNNGYDNLAKGESFWGSGW